jgi:hypothetical protein
VTRPKVSSITTIKAEESPLAAAGVTAARADLTDRSGDIDLTIFLLLDGVRSDVLRALAAAGELPNISRYLLAQGSYVEGITVLPSVTNVAYIPILTGQYPGPANVPGVRWVDKSRFTSGKLFIAGHRSYVGLAHLRLDGDLSAGLETLFELCPDSLAVRSDIHRGLAQGRNRGRTRATLGFMFTHYLKRGYLVDRIMMRSLMGALDDMRDGLPRFIFLSLFDVDTSSHAYGPRHRRTVSAYKRIDDLIGAIVDRLRRLGVWERTHFLISSDHGHTETREHLDLPRLLKDMNYSVFEHPNIYRRGADAAVMVSGNSFANLYLASEGEWERSLTDHDLEGEHGCVLSALVQRAEIEWVAFRCEDGAIKIVSSLGKALLNKEGEYYVYAHEGKDPLDLGLPHTRVRVSDALGLTVGTRFPDALEQIWQLFTSRRTGDVVITSKPGYDLRARHEWPEHHSSHGALCEGQMRVPILSNRPLSSEGPARTVDLFPTISESLGVTPTKPHSGKSLW